MLLGLLCSKCRAKLEIDAALPGTEVVCPQCGALLPIPPRVIGPGVTIGDIRIVSLLNSGGMGDVYRAVQLSLEREVALKILPPNFARDRDSMERFYQEVRVLAKLEHPHIVTAYEAGEDNGILYLAMKYVPGGSIADRISQDGPYDEETALRLGRNLAEALGYAWDKGRLLHRDVKPANVLLDEQGEAKLADFGLSKSLAAGMAGVTMAPMLMGSPNYMSPEQADGTKELDIRSDIYALGATLYHMLTGQLPFSGTTLMETMRKQLTEPLPDPREWNAGMSNACVVLLEQMLARDREKRHGCWAELIHDMSRVMAGQYPQKTQLSAGESMMSRWEIGSNGHKKRIKVSSRKIGELHYAATRATASRECGRRRKRLLASGMAAGSVVLVGIAIGLIVRSKGRLPAAQPLTPNAAVTPSLSTPPVAAPRKVADDRPVAERQAAAAEQSARAEEARQKALAAEAAAAQEALTREQEKIAEDAREAEAQRLAHARQKLAGMLDEVAGDLLKQDFVKLQARLAGAEKEDFASLLAAEWRGIRSSVEKVAGLRRSISDSFRADIGKAVTVYLTRGCETLHITGVDGEDIQAEKRVAAGQTYAAVSMDFRYKDLTTREKLTRLGESGEAERRVMRALVTLEAKNVDEAKRLLESSDCALARTVKMRLESELTRKELAVLAEENAAQEEAAAKQYRALLALACPEASKGTVLSMASNDVAQLTWTIMRKRYTEAQVAAINKTATAFCADHANTVFVKGREPVIKALHRLIPNMPLVVDADTLEHVKQNLQKTNPGGDIICISQVEDAGLVLDLCGNKNLMSIKSLAGLPVTTLDLSNTLVSDLRPLKGAPLQSLKLVNCTNLFDLLPLAGMRLTLLDLNNCRNIADLRPLIGMPLTALDIKDCTKITDLNALHGMQLTSLFILNSNISDLIGLRGMPLVDLSIDSCNRPISDLRPLAGMKLKSFRLAASWASAGSGWHTVRSLVPLQGMPLTKLHLSNCPDLMDLRPLQGMPLVMLEIGGYKANSGCPLLSDLSPLRGLPLTRLWLCYSPSIQDLSPLQGMPLMALNLEGCSGVTDITPLKDMPLTELNLRGTRVSDLSPLKQITTLQKVKGRDGKDTPVPR